MTIKTGKRVLIGLVVLEAVVLLFGVKLAYGEMRTPKDGPALQVALDAAQPGDVIILQKGVRYIGEFKLPPRTEGTAITIRSSETLSDRRVGPLDSANLPTLTSGVAAPVLTIVNTASWVIDGVRLESTAHPSGETVVIQGSKDITLRRILETATTPQKRGIRGNGQKITLRQSYVAGIWAAGADSQAFAAWDGAGPYTLSDNYLEAAGENVMFGGADASNAAAMPSDILVEKNLLSKPLTWKGTGKVIKNLFELKAARRAIIRQNVFENNWSGEGQSGYAIVFTPRNQDGKAPWSTVTDVVFEQNIVRNTPSCYNLLGWDGENGPSGQLTNITVRQNLCLGSGGTFALIQNEAGTVVFDHNTFVQPRAEAAMLGLYADPGSRILLPDGTSREAKFAVENLTFTNNLVQGNAYGLFSSSGIGAAALKAMARQWTWNHNVLAGGSGGYPPGTFFPTQATFAAQLQPETYVLAPTSIYARQGSEGTNIGWSGLTSTPVPTEPLPSSDLEARVKALEERVNALIELLRKAGGQ